MRVPFVTAFPNIASAFAACMVMLLTGCNRQSNAVSGTIEVDEVHVASRSAGRVEKIFAWEGDSLKTNTPIVQLEPNALKLAPMTDKGAVKSAPRFLSEAGVKP